jgi:hypothetical protein
MTDATFHHEHTIDPIANDAPTPAHRLPMLEGEWRDLAVVVGGSIFMALAGMGLATWLALPFNN